MSRSTIIVVIILIFACLWFSTAFSTCSPGHTGGIGGVLPIFIGGGGGWNRGGWDRSSPPSSSPSSPSPSSPSRSSGGGLRGGGISGGRGGK